MKKLGVFLPTRPELRKTNYDLPGIFLDKVGSTIIAELKKDFEVFEDLDFRKASVIDGTVYFDEFDSSELNGYFWFSAMDKNSDGHDILALAQLEKSMPVINPSKGLKIGLDKFKTSSFLKAHKIPVPDFALIKSDDEKSIRNIFETWGSSVLAKPRYGGFGIGIFKADNADQFMDLLDFSAIDTVYIERFYENDMNDWCGVNVVGKRILYGYGKKPNKIKGYKVFDRNQKGGEMVLKEPDEEQAKIALEVAKETDMDFFGVDIIKSRQGEYLVVDMNTFPGIYPEIMEPIKIAKEFSRMIREKVYRIV